MVPFQKPELHGSLLRRIAVASLLLTFGSVMASCHSGETQPETIHDAVTNGDIVKVKTMLKSNPALVFDKEKDFGDTPLDEAVLWREKDIAKLLLESNSNVNARNNNGETPLYVAAELGEIDMIGLLLTRHADISTKGISGETPLHRAAVSNNMDLAEFLLTHGAQINAKDDSGQTPLDKAVSLGSTQVEGLLRKHGGRQLHKSPPLP